MGSTPRVIRNDWSRVAVPDLADWQPTLSVSVIIPAYQGQPTLDLTLASLSRQSYPAHLLEVIVVDDGSDPPLALPDIRPVHTTLLRVGDSGWGRANALAWGAAHSRGEILHWLDSDMVVFPDHVAAQARWQHELPYAVTLGYKRFVDIEPAGAWPSAATVAQAWDRGEADGLFGGNAGEPHTYVERYIAQTDQMRAADHLAFRFHVGATAALRRKLYEAAGGFDTGLRLGEDTEFGYRLAQAGAVFVPEPLARSWHLGRTHMMRAREQVSRYNRPYLADRIPYPRHWRRLGGTAWSVPLVEAVVPVDGQPLERVRAAVDSLLRGTERDVRVNLVGPWDELDEARVRVLADPRLDLRLIAASYRGDPAVRLVTRAPASVFPAAYRLDLPAGFGLAPRALRHLVDVADRHQAGVVSVVGATGVSGPGDAAVRLWRTAAVGRAGWVQAEDESLLDAVASVYGRREVNAEEAGVVDLMPYDPADLDRGVAALSTGPGRRRASGFAPSIVEVEGVRSLAKATVVVAWLGGRRLMTWLRPRRAVGG